MAAGNTCSAPLLYGRSTGDLQNEQNKTVMHQSLKSQMQEKGEKSKLAKSKRVEACVHSRNKNHGSVCPYVKEIKPSIPPAQRHTMSMWLRRQQLSIVDSRRVHSGELSTTLQNSALFQGKHTPHKDVQYVRYSSS